MDSEVPLESDEEDILVYAEFSESVNIDKYRSIHVLGIDGKSPVIQADDTFFTGKFSHALGTYMFFEEDSSPKSENTLFDKLPERNLKYVLKTNKLVNIEHAYVIPKAGAETDPILKNDAPPSDDIKPVKFGSVEEALKSFRTIMSMSTAENESSQTPMECSSNIKGVEDMQT